MNDKLINMIRNIARACSIIMILLFMTFFIGEGILNNLEELKATELILLIFVPIALFVGTFIAWKNELIGGIVIFSSIILFNLFDMILFEKNTISFNFSLCLIIGILFVIIGIHERKRKNRF